MTREAFLQSLGSPCPGHQLRDGSRLQPPLARDCEECLWKLAQQHAVDAFNETVGEALNSGRGAYVP